MRLHKTIAAGAAALTFFVACGGSKATPLETVQNASSQTSDAKTASIAMTITGGSGALKNIEMNGAYDFDNRILSFEMDAAKLGLENASGKIQAVMDFSHSVVEYLKFPGLKDEIGKNWLKVDIADAVASVCPDFDFAALLQSQSGDPTSALQAMKVAKSVTEIGKEKVRGEDTTHYKVTVDIRDVAAKAPESSRETMRQMASWYVDPVQTSDVWLDGRGRARKSETIADSANLKLPECLSASQAQNPFSGTTKVTYELFDFGKKVDIKVPAASDTANIADLTN